ncbi:alpha-amylase family glycosyl hydrolase [Alkalibacillus aidingensis]|uniref:alpha-amylase family glycosyl hydrolase n=1 Tax=Alkalibacillus aidingensis TaxID=2747607 RepID=UPI00166154BC|nr:alpha-amylase family glycosyl hydrolase [Alkalibacillus aidingensis]
MKRLLYMVLLILFSCLVAPLVGFADGEEDEQHSYYYILIDRFQNSNQASEDVVDRGDPLGFHGGEFAGIADRVSHLNELGITHVVLSPVFSSEDYLGQVVSDYESVQETYGTLDELQSVVETLSDHGIETILHFPINQVSSDSALIDEDWISENGDIFLEEDAAQDYMVEMMRHWQELLETDGFYVNDIDERPLSFWEEASSQLSDQLWIGQLNNFDEENFDLYLDGGFDRILNQTFRDEAIDIFKDVETELSSLVSGPFVQDSRVIHYMDTYHTDRFTRAMEETGFHPITRWKMALTFMFMTPNEPWLFQGTEVPMDGEVEDATHHDMVNFLGGDDQLIRHIEKLTSLVNEFPALRDGSMEVLHDEGDFLVFERNLDDEQFIVAINNSTGQEHVDLTHLDSNLELSGLLDNDLVRENEDGAYTIALGREAVNVYQVQTDQGINWTITLVFVGIMGGFMIFAFVMYRKNKNARGKE